MRKERTTPKLGTVTSKVSKPNAPRTRAAPKRAAPPTKPWYEPADEALGPPQRDPFWRGLDKTWRDALIANYVFAFRFSESIRNEILVPRNSPHAILNARLKKRFPIFEPTTEQLASIRSLPMCYLAALELTSLEPLSKISGLKVLDVSENPALSWRGYSAPSTLVELFAARSGLEDLSALRHARALEEVLLAENLGLSDLDVLADMPSLRQIDVKLTSVRDLAPLRHAEKLVALYCDFCPALDSLDALSGMRSLEIFSCEGTERELDLRPLLALPRLTRVVIDKNAGAKMRGVCAELGRRGVAIELGGEATPRG